MPKARDTSIQKKSVLTLLKRPNVHENDRSNQKLWQTIQSELSKELFRFSKDITANIGTYNQLVEVVVKCDIPLTWLDRAKEDYPEDS